MPIADQYLRELERAAGYKSEWLRLSMEREQFHNPTKNASPPNSSPTPSESTLIDQFSKSIEPTSSIETLSNRIFDLMAGISLARREELIPFALEKLFETRNSSIENGKNASLPEALALANIRLSSKPKAMAFIEAWLIEHAPAKSIGSATTARAIGDAVYISGNPTGAIEYYRVALDKNPHDVNSANNLAAAIAEQEDTEGEAYKWVDIAIEMEPNNPERKDTKLVVAILIKDWDQAMEISKQLSDQYSGNILMHRAIVASETGHIDEAKNLFDQSRDANVESTLIVPSDKQMFRRLQSLFMNVDQQVGQPVS